MNGDGSCTSASTCQAGEAVELTNLSNCPVTLAGDHFAYRSSDDNNAAVRWMNFGADDVTPPRGVYVTIRERDASACDVNMPAESTVNAADVQAIITYIEALATPATP